ncbi:MAG: acetyl-CoA carboxylase carboxyltransferase subunit beta [Lachnospiraceae bacterium]|nr:acetyl-CoA carboxylase carboxyltransferase subunit beta [Lachnospiraceae bacterium]
MNNLFGARRNHLTSLKELRSEKISGNKKEEKHKDIECPSCKNEYNRALLKSKLYVCPNCNYHLPISARRRVVQLVDYSTFQEQKANLSSGNPIGFPEYENKLKAGRERTGNNDAIITGVGKINGYKAEIIVLDGKFMMGSMGTVVGEKFTLAVEYAMKNNLPVVAVSASGGARMQEGMFSLMQMAKTSAVIEKFSEKGGLFISVLTHPTMGGVSASFAMLGDIILAEPQALIGFAGPRVIEQTIKEKLPNGFQRSEFQEEHGFVDRIVQREELKDVIGTLLGLHKKDGNSNGSL